MGAAAAQQQQQPQMDPAAAWYYHYTQSTVADSVLKAAALYQTQQGVSPFWGRPLGGGGPAVSLHGGPTQTLAGACLLCMPGWMHAYSDCAKPHRQRILEHPVSLDAMSKTGFEKRGIMPRLLF